MTFPRDYDLDRLAGDALAYVTLPSSEWLIAGTCRRRRRRRRSLSLAVVTALVAVVVIVVGARQHAGSSQKVIDVPLPTSSVAGPPVAAISSIAQHQAESFGDPAFSSSEMVETSLASAVPLDGPGLSGVGDERVYDVQMTGSFTCQGSCFHNTPSASGSVLTIALDKNLKVVGTHLGTTQVNLASLGPVYALQLLASPPNAGVLPPLKVAIREPSRIEADALGREGCAQPAQLTGSQALPAVHGKVQCTSIVVSLEPTDLPGRATSPRYDVTIYGQLPLIPRGLGSGPMYVDHLNFVYDAVNGQGEGTGTGGTTLP